MIEQLQDFHFLRPEWLFALLPLLLLIIGMRHFQQQQSGWQSVLAGHLYQHLISHKQNKHKPPLWMLALGWILTVLALAGPAWEKLPQPVYQLHTGKVIVMDMSLSMRATDVKPDRLTRARYKAIDLIKAVAEGETGLVAYAGEAFIISPLSTDAQNLTALLPSLSPEIMPVKGSEPYLGLKEAADLLTNAGYQQGEIFWITDGIEISQIAEINQLITEIPFRISVLGVGTEQGAPVKLTDGELLKDRKGAIVVPKLQASKLQAIADKSLGRYAPMQADDADIQYLTSQNQLQKESQQQDQQQQNFGDKWQEAGPYLLLLLLPFAAYSFRRGLLTCVPLLLMLPLYTPQAQANWWQDLWQTPNQQGQQAFDQQDYSQASELFEDPLWQGSAAYKDGNYQQAAEAFSQLDTAEGWYNLGNSLAKMQQLDQAIEAYNKALEKQPQHQDAMFNKELLEQMQQQQDSEQQQQDNQQQQNSEQQQQDNQQQQDSEQQQQDNQQQQNSEQQQQDNQQQQNSEQQQQDNQQQQNSEQQQDNQQQQNSEQQQDNQQQQNSEQQQQDNQRQQSSEQQQQNNQQQQDSEQQQLSQEQQEAETKEGQQQQAQAQQQELTDEQKEQMQKMQNLLRKVPDDPAYLLKRKMQLEHQQRRRQRIPNQQQRNW